MSNWKAYISSRVSWLFHWEWFGTAKTCRHTPTSNTPLTWQTAGLPTWNHNFDHKFVNAHIEDSIDIISNQTHRSSRKKIQFTVGVTRQGFNIAYTVW
jgi:hypothetical protein